MIITLSINEKSTIGQHFYGIVQDYTSMSNDVKVAHSYNETFNSALDEAIEDVRCGRVSKARAGSIVDQILSE